MILEAVKVALNQQHRDYVHAQHIHNPERDEIWLRNERRAVGPRWCVIEVVGTVLLIENGRNCKRRVDLNDPSSIEYLGYQLVEALDTTAMFVSAPE